LKPAEWEHLSAAEREAMDGLEKTSPPDSLARSEREEALTRWLDGNGVAEGWRLSPNFVSAGLDAAWLSALNGAGANDQVLVLEAIAT
jgi:hypothetical protein